MFLPFTCNVLGYITLVANDAKTVHFTFYKYFTGALEATMFLVATQSGAGAVRAKKLNKRERDMKKYGRAGPRRSQSGSAAARKRCKR